MKFTSKPVYSTLYTTGHCTFQKLDVDNNDEGDYFSQFHTIKNNIDPVLEQLIAQKKVIIIRKMAGDDRNGNFFALLEHQYVNFTHARQYFIEHGTLCNIRDVKFSGRMKKLITYDGGFEESINMTKYFRYPIDIDCKNVAETVEVFNKIYSGIKTRDCNLVDRYFRGRHAGHDNIHDKDFEPVFIEKKTIEKMGNESNDIYSMVLSVVVSIKETVKQFGKQESLNIGEYDGPMKFVIRASMFNDKGLFIKNAPKYSFHMIFNGIIFNNPRIAARFTLMMIANLIIMYIKGANYRPIEFHPDDCINDFETLWMTICGRLEYDANTKCSISDFRKIANGSNYLPYKNSAKIIYDIFDMGLYAPRHNLRLMYEPKNKDDKRYSIPITRSHAMIPENNYHMSSSMFDCNETILLDMNNYVFVESESNNDIDTKYYKTGVYVDKLNDKFLNEMANKVTSEYPQFDVRSAQVSNGKISMILFNRLAPDAKSCPFCNRRHDKDNTFYLSVTYNENADRSVFLRCRHADKSPVAGIANYRLVGSEQKRESVSNKIKGIINKSVNMQHYSAFYNESEMATIQTETDYKEINRKELNKIDFSNDLTFIHSGMGTGKTKSLMKYICKRLEDDESNDRFVSISFRQTQANDMENKYNEFIENADVGNRHNYFCNYQKCNDFSHYRNFIVQVESLSKIDLPAIAKTKYTLILDEIMSIIQQFDSENCRKESRHSYDTFEWLIKHAHKIIIMDAHMTFGPYELIKSIRSYRDTSDTIMYYYNNYLTHEKYKYNIIDDKHEWLTQLAQCVKENKRCVIATSSLKKAGEIHTFVTTSGILPEDKKVKLYTSETSKVEKMKDFSDVNKYWKDVDILIYSPTAGAGISFECRGFDVLFGYFVSRSCTAEADIQLLGRVRDFKDRKVYIYATDLEYSLPTTKEQLYEFTTNNIYSLDNVSRDKQLGGDHKHGRTLLQYIEGSINDEGHWVPVLKNNPKNILEVHIELNKNRSHASILRRLITIICTMSHKVQYYVVPAEYNRYCFKDYEKKYKEIRSELVSSAANITDAEYRELIELTKKGTLITMPEQLSINKYQMARDYNISIGALDSKEFVYDYLDDPEDQFSRLSVIYDCHDLKESMDKMIVSRYKDQLVKLSRNDHFNKTVIDTNDIKTIQTLCEILRLLGINDITCDYTLYYDETADGPCYTKYIYRILELIESLGCILEKRKFSKSISIIRKSYETNDKTQVTRHISKILTDIYDPLFGMTFPIRNGVMYFYRNDNFDYQESVNDRELGVEKPKVMTRKLLYKMYSGASIEDLNDDYEDDIGDLTDYSF